MRNRRAQDQVDGPCEVVHARRGSSLVFLGFVLGIPMAAPHWLDVYAPSPHPDAPFSVRWSDSLTGRNPGSDAVLPKPLQETLFDAGKGSTFAVLDGAILTHLPDRLAESGLEHACLYSGDAASNLGAIAPYLVRLKADNDLTQDLLTDGPAPWHNWRDPIGMFLQSSLELPDLRAHLRKFTRLPKGDTGSWVLFRFWQADILAGLALRGPFELAAALLHPKAVSRALLPCGHRFVIVEPAPGAPPRSDTPRLGRATHEAMGHMVQVRFFHDLDHDCLAQGEAPEAHVSHVLTALQRLGFSGRQTIRDLARWWCTRDGASAMETDWAQSELLGTIGFPDPVRRDRLFNLVDDRRSAIKQDADNATG